jgi:hypothetical protein
VEHCLTCERKFHPRGSARQTSSALVHRAPPALKDLQLNIELFPDIQLPATIEVIFGLVGMAAPKLQ